MVRNLVSQAEDLARPVVNQIKDVIVTKLNEIQDAARQLGDEVAQGFDNVIQDVTGQPRLAIEGADNATPGQINQPKGNEPSQSTGVPDNLKPAQPEKVINDLKSFQTRTFNFGNETFQLDKSGMKHILERHHPQYWNGTTKTDQSFLDAKLTIDDVADIAGEVMKQNRDRIIERGTNRTYQIRGSYQGVEYVLGFRNGRVGQLYPSS